MGEPLPEADCSICLQSLLQPAELPCGHIFCYLCIKGSSFHGRRCPLCRGIINRNYFDSPKLIKLPTKPSNYDSRQPTDLVWYYEGRNGWWQYDSRTSDEIESAFSLAVDSCEVFIAGHVYVIDFLQMRQMRKDCSGRSRHIKRDSVALEKKGISGIRLSIINTTRTEESESLHATACFTPSYTYSIDTNNNSILPSSSGHSGEIISLLSANNPKNRISSNSVGCKEAKRRSLSLDNSTRPPIKIFQNMETSCSVCVAISPSGVGLRTRSRKSCISLI